MPPFTVSTFYKFAPVADPAALRRQLAELCARHAIRGTILIAHEGINATIAGADVDVGAVLAWLRADPRFQGLVSKQSAASEMPFQRMKVKIKREIVRLDAPEADPNLQVGTYVKPEDWNALISRDDVILVDTRNDYEVAIGTFRGALDPKTKSFTGFKDYVRDTLDPAAHPKVAMFCTGGIRCEKASAYLLAHGFPEVYHLEGGILKYLEDVPREQSLWAGECFVFDERVALDHGAVEGRATLCRACGWPVTPPAQAGGAEKDVLRCLHCGTEIDCVERNPSP
jgi:UPF0176 protein